MEYGRLFLDPTYGCHGGNMLFVGNGEQFFREQRSMISVEESAKRRLFFSSAEELYDDEYYDDQLPEKKRRLTPEQVHLLEKSFESENKLEADRKSQLAKKLSLQPRQVAVWFQNRRARWKAKQLERDYNGLKSNYDSLSAEFDSIHKENERLKSEMTCLMEKLQAQNDREAGAVEGPPPVQKLEPIPEEAADVIAVRFNIKMEDRLSSGSWGSAVVDLEEGLQLVDSGDSYFSDVFGAGAAVVAEHHQHQQEEGETLGWWVWPN